MNTTGNLLKRGIPVGGVVLLLLVSPGRFAAAQTCIQAPEGLVRWWPGDGNTDEIIGGYNGTLIGSVTFGPGKVGQAFSFSSSSSLGSDRVNLTSAPSASNFTIEAWVFANQIDGPNGRRTIYADNGRGLWLKNGRINWWNGNDRFVGCPPITTGGWHHIALTYSQGIFTGYVHGQPCVGTSTSPGESLPTGAGLGIGGHSSYPPEDFDGLIDEIEIYDRALSASQIQAIFDSGSAGKCKASTAPKDVYAVKFLCGNFLPEPPSPPAGEAEWPVKPGNYFTAINVHNPNGSLISFEKRAVLLYRADKPPEPEKPMPPGPLFLAELKPNYGFEIDCSDIRNKLLSGAAPAPTLIKGWVVIEVRGNKADPLQLDVTAVYTSHGWDQSGKVPVYEGFAEDVEQILPKHVK
ncbi:MAG TPA: LamG domain-containing protein [Thermoanaerobaculia bacterium]